MPKKLISIQLLRFVAALLVVYTHAVNNAAFLTSDVLGLAPAHLADVGAIGVDIFFVISGFVIATTIASRPDQTVWVFINNRLLRIIPLYLIASIPWAAISLSRVGFNHEILITSLFFWPVTDNGFLHPYLEAGWSLCFEMLFYSSIAFTLAMHAKVPAYTLTAIYLVLVGLGRFIDSPTVHYLGNPILAEFLFGVILFILIRDKASVSHSLGAAAIVAFLISILSCAYFGCADVNDYKFTLDGSLSAMRVILWGVPALLLVFGMLQFETVFSHSKRAFIWSALGDASYAIYLVHQLVAWEINSMIRNLHLVLSGDAIILFIILASVTIGLGIWIFVERPLVKFLRSKLPDKGRVRALYWAMER